MIEPGDDDTQDAYKSYAVRDDPSVFIGVAPEVGDGNSRPGSSYSGLDAQPLLDRITTLAGEDGS